MSKSYRFKCRNQNCGAEFHRYYPKDEFEKNQYGTANGWACFNCGFPKMAVMYSNKDVKDVFVAGWQPTIRKYCSSYSEYKRELKARGLIEIGYEELKPKEESKSYSWNDSEIKDMYNKGILDSTDGQLIDLMKKGEL